MAATVTPSSLTFDSNSCILRNYTKMGFIRNETDVWCVTPNGPQCVRGVIGECDKSDNRFKPSAEYIKSRIEDFAPKDFRDKIDQILQHNCELSIHFIPDEIYESNQKWFEFLDVFLKDLSSMRASASDLITLNKYIRMGFFRKNDTEVWCITDFGPPRYVKIDPSLDVKKKIEIIKTKIEIWTTASFKNKVNRILQSYQILPEESVPSNIYESDQNWINYLDTLLGKLDATMTKINIDKKVQAKFELYQKLGILRGEDRYYSIVIPSKSMLQGQLIWSAKNLAKTLEQMKRIINNNLSPELANRILQLADQVADGTKLEFMCPNFVPYNANDHKNFLKYLERVTTNMNLCYFTNDISEPVSPVQAKRWCEILINLGVLSRTKIFLNSSTSITYLTMKEGKAVKENSSHYVSDFENQIYYDILNHLAKQNIPVIVLKLARFIMENDVVFNTVVNPINLIKDETYPKNFTISCSFKTRPELGQFVRTRYILNEYDWTRSLDAHTELYNDMTNALIVKSEPSTSSDIIQATLGKSLVKDGNPTNLFFEVTGMYIEGIYEIVDFSKDNVRIIRDDNFWSFIGDVKMRPLILASVDANNTATPASWIVITAKFVKMYDPTKTYLFVSQSRYAGNPAVALYLHMQNSTK